MTTITDMQDHAQRVANQVAADAATPSAVTDELLSQFRDRLSWLDQEIARHKAETKVILQTVAETAESELARLRAAETTIRADLERNAAEQDRVVRKSGDTAASIGADRAGQMAELDRQRAILQAGIEAGAKAV